MIVAWAGKVLLLNACLTIPGQANVMLVFGYRSFFELLIQVVNHLNG